MEHPAIGVVGASGGVGVSTLVVALAARASPVVGAVACVDGDFAGGGLDVTACLEHLPGLRWPDLAGARGEVDGAALLQALPSEHSVAVLGARGASPGDPVVDAALVGLRAVCGLTVVDLGRSLDLIAACTTVVVVAGTSARQLADADAMSRQLARAGSAPPVPAVLALRRAPGEQISAEEVADHLDLPLGAVLRHDPKVLRGADRAAMPGVGRSSVSEAAEELLTQLEAATSMPRGRRR